MFGRLTKRQKAAETVTLPEGVEPCRVSMDPSVIAANMNVLGNIVSEGILDIDGQVDGNVRGHMVTVRPNGRIRGDLMAKEVHVHGIVDGLIKAELVNLYSTAQVRGTVMHDSITVEDGAQVDGKLKRTERIMITDQRVESTARGPIIDSSSPTSMLDSGFMNDNDEPTTEAEIRILNNLRLIS